MDSGMLKKLGMTSKEAKLYLKLLELGTAGANVLAKSISENRTSAYSLLQAMIRKGFVSFVVKNGVKYFSATNPQLLIGHYFEEAKQLKEVLPELMAITNKYGQKPKITFYEGVEGIKQICETLLQVPDSVRESFMGINSKTIHPEIKRYFEEDFIDRRIGLGIKYRGIITGYIPMGTKHAETEKSQLRELKYVDPKKFPIKIHIDIFPENKVALYSYNKDEMMGVIIEHESFYITMKTAFKLAWAGVDTFG
jgi:HTH-type transcriptional regulator, sugar sensing transcriptional regulator